MITSLFVILAIIYAIIDIWRKRNLWYALAGVAGWVVAAVLVNFTNGHSVEIFFAIAIGVGIGVALQIVVQHSILRLSKESLACDHRHR